MTRTRLLDAAIPQDLELVVVIPSHNEPDLLVSLKSIADCEAVDGIVEVIVVINASEDSEREIKERNLETYAQCKSWAADYSLEWLNFYFLLENDLPRKHAGVGLARKIGMDEAAQRLFLAGKPCSAIACFDADSTCDKNYLRHIISHFNDNPVASACSIYLEHPIYGDLFPPETYSAIQQYELHLRYYRQALQFAAAPFAFHTVGSSMAVRADEYCKQGGMNKRKAGEDFYFLQKFIELGSFSELNTTTVFPSPRPSDRVPFGTGRSIKQHLENERSVSKTYHPHTFVLLKDFFEQMPMWFEKTTLPSAEILDFLGGETTFRGVIDEIREQCKTKDAFQKRFFRWFNAFKTLKFVHHMRDTKLGDCDVVGAALELEKMKDVKAEQTELLEVLQRFRQRDRI